MEMKHQKFLEMFQKHDTLYIYIYIYIWHLQFSMYTYISYKI
jgi:hypothetical protein